MPENQTKAPSYLVSELLHPQSEDADVAIGMLASPAVAVQAISTETAEEEATANSAAG